MPYQPGPPLPDVAPQPPQSGVQKYAPKAMQAVVAFLAAQKAGPLAAAAFMQGVQQAKMQSQQTERQGMLDQSVLQTQQQTRDNLTADNTRADQQQSFNQMHTAMGDVNAYANTVADTATDPAQAENQVMQRAATTAGMYGMAPDALTGLVPPMAPMISTRTKKRAQAILDGLEKNPSYAGYAGKPEFEELTVKDFPQPGDTRKVKEIRAMVGGGIAEPPKPKDPEAGTAASLDAQFSDVLAGEEAKVGHPLGRAEKAALRLRVKKDYDAANDRPLQPKSEPRNRFNVQPITRPDGSTGLVRINMDTGETSAVDLPDGAISGRASDTTKLSAGYESRTTAADTTARTFESSLAALGDQVDVQLPNLLKSPQGQKYKQAEDEFINAALRRESGAAIQPSEYDRFERIYFVRPGDTAATIAQKQEARKRVVEGFKIASGGLGKKPTGPTVGERRLINGTMGEWDGKGWKAVAQ